MSKFDVGQLATLACILEISAPKPGNVSRCADFPDMTFEQMLCGAVAIGPPMRNAATRAIGATVLDAVRATREAARTNTNLGTVLLLAPLAKVAANRSVTDRSTDESRREAVAAVLNQLAPEDAANVYEAIQVANPGGMGTSAQHDLNDGPPQDLIEAMRFAASTDLIAAQYANGFSDFFEAVVPMLTDNLNRIGDLRLAIVHSHLELMAQFPDSLIGRKRGPKVAKQAADMASQTISSGPVGSDPYTRATADLDFWLRADGNARNPGTTADFIAAGLFVLLQEGVIDAI